MAGSKGMKCDNCNGFGMIADEKDIDWDCEQCGGTGMTETIEQMELEKMLDEWFNAKWVVCRGTGLPETIERHHKIATEAKQSILQQFKALEERCGEMEVYKGYCLYCQSAEIQNLGTPLQFNEWRKQQIECGYIKDNRLNKGEE